MGAQVAPHPVDAAIALLAARQYGVVGRSQLRALGVSRGQVGGRLRRGVLHLVHRGVYAVGHRGLAREGQLLAAVLACGKGAVLSHSSAAWVWGLPGDERPPAHVTVPGRGARRPPPAIRVHRARLPRADVTRRSRLPLTSPARTLIDLADVVSERRLERALDEAHYLRLDLNGLEPRHGRPGSGRLARVLAGHHAGTTRTRSDLEEELLGLCRRFGFPRPGGVNVEVEGHLVDFAWPERRLVVEVDGWQAHGTRRAFERDRLRDLELTAAGWRVVRLTWRRMTRHPAAAAAQLARLLGSGAT